MTQDEYVYQIIGKYTDSDYEIMQVETLANLIANDLAVWAGESLSKIDFSGAYAKGTAIKGSSDIDLFISLKSSTTNTLGEIFEMLYNLAVSKNWQPRRQNVSIRIIQNNYQVDLVPAKKQNDYHVWHSLYKSKTNTWTQTNVASHISTIKNSNRINEIKAVKIWRNLNNLDFPSFYLELTVINALYGKQAINLADNVLTALNYIAKYLPNSRVIDPANTNNVISNDLSAEEKSYIANIAGMSANQPHWENIIW